MNLGNLRSAIQGLPDETEIETVLIDSPEGMEAEICGLHEKNGRFFVAVFVDMHFEDEAQEVSDAKTET